MFVVGGYKPWEDEAAGKPRRRYIDAFRVLSMQWMVAQPALTATWLARAFGGTDA